MEYKIQRLNGCWEISFYKSNCNIVLVIEDTLENSYIVYTDSRETKSIDMPKGIYDMVKDEYKLKRQLPKIDIEDIEPLPWE